jgi:hypothetical protein
MSVYVPVIGMVPVGWYLGILVVLLIIGFSCGNGEKTE